MEFGFYTIEHKSPGLFPVLEKTDKGYKSLIFVFNSKPDSTYLFNYIKYFIWNPKRRKWELGVKKRDDYFKKIHKPQDFDNKHFIIKTFLQSKSFTKTFRNNLNLIR